MEMLHAGEHGLVPMVAQERREMPLRMLEPESAVRETEHPGLVRRKLSDRYRVLTISATDLAQDVCVAQKPS